MRVGKCAIKNSEEEWVLLSDGRVATGIAGFDDLVEGGFPRGSLVLLAGEAGSGKIVFSAQYLYNGISKHDEPGIYVSFAENRDAFLANMKRIGLDFEKYAGKFRFLEYITVTEKGVPDVLDGILTEIADANAKRLVIDSFSAMAQAFKEPIDARMIIHTILGKMVRQSGCTTLLIAEKNRGEERVGVGIEEFVADGVVLLTLTAEKGFLERKMQLVKMRGTDIGKSALKFDITGHGIEIHQPFKIVPLKAFTERLPTGVKGLDEMLGGGLLKTSSTMVVGASGAGKTTTALHFIVEGAKRGERVLYVSYEEQVAKLVQHGEGFGWDMKGLVDKGLLRIVHFDVQPHDIQAIASEITRHLSEHRPTRLAIDTVTPVERAMGEEEYLDYVKGWTNALAANEVTFLFTQLSEPTTVMTGAGVSTMVDNIISLRDVELESSLKRSLVILKARGTAHDRDIREFEITSKGVIVGERFVGVEQILGGAAKRSFSREAASAWTDAFAKKGR